MADTALPAARPTHVRWGIFALACSTSWLLYLHRYVFGFIKPMLAEEWQLSATELGQIESAFSICYAGLQFPLALLADLLGVHLVLTGLLLGGCAGLTLMAWAPTPGWMWFAQALFGTGQSAVYACLSRIGRVWYPPAMRTTMQGLVGVFAGRLGAVGASLIFSTLLLGMLQFTVPQAILTFVAAGLINVLLFAVLYRNAPRRHPGVNTAEADLIDGVSATDPAAEPAVPDAPRLSVLQMLRGLTPRSCRNVLCLTLQTTLSTFADNIYSSWIPLFLAQVHSLKYKEMGIYSALPLLGGALAGFIGGVLNDWLIARTGNARWSRVAVAGTGKGMAALLLFAALWFYDQPYVFCGFLFFVKLFGDWSVTTTWGVVTDIGGRATASVFAFNNSIAGLGLIAAPLAFGYLADRYGWQAVFIAVAITYLLCALSWLGIDSTIPVLNDPVERTQ